MSYHKTTGSTTNAQGKTAPTGYHYMPDGALMSDAEHKELLDNDGPEKSVLPVHYHVWVWCKTGQQKVVVASPFYGISPQPGTGLAQLSQIFYSSVGSPSPGQTIHLHQGTGPNGVVAQNALPRPDLCVTYVGFSVLPISSALSSAVLAVTNTNVDGIFTGCQDCIQGEPVPCTGNTITPNDPNWGYCLECIAMQPTLSPWPTMTGINCECCDDTPILDTWDCVKQVSWEAPLPDEHKCLLRTDGSGQFTSLQACTHDCYTTGHILTPDGPIEPQPIQVGKIIKKNIYVKTQKSVLFEDTSLSDVVDYSEGSIDKSYTDYLSNITISRDGEETSKRLGGDYLLFSDEDSTLLDIAWGTAKLVAGPDPGPYCSNTLQFVYGDDGSPNPLPMTHLWVGGPLITFCSFRTPIPSGSIGGWNGNAPVNYGTWRSGYELWVMRPQNQWGNWGNRGAFIDLLSVTPYNTTQDLGVLGLQPEWDNTNQVMISDYYTNPCSGATWSQYNPMPSPGSYQTIGPIPWLQSYCVEERFRWSGHPSPTNFRVPYIDIDNFWFPAMESYYRNYDESVWDLMGSTNGYGISNSGETKYILNRILQEISCESNVRYQPYDQTSNVQWKYIGSPNYLRFSAVTSLYTSINASDAGVTGKGWGNQIFNPPLGGSKLKPGEHCISYACHSESKFAPDSSFEFGSNLMFDKVRIKSWHPTTGFTRWDTSVDPYGTLYVDNDGCYSNSPWSGKPLNNYYSWITLNSISVFIPPKGTIVGSWQPTTAWTFSNIVNAQGGSSASKTWTGNIPTSLSSAKESAIELMMYLGDSGGWDSNGTVFNSPVFGLTKGGPVGYCWLPANQFDSPGTGHWVIGTSSGGYNCDVPGVPSNYTGADTTSSNQNALETAHWTTMPDMSAFYYGIRPNYSFLDVAQHLKSMQEYMPMSVERPTYDWTNRPCDHPYGLPFGCSGSACLLLPTGGGNCGGHVANGLPNVVNPEASVAGNSNQGGGTCCTQAYMQGNSYKNAAFDNDPSVPIPLGATDNGTAGTYDGIYNGFNCCGSRWINLNMMDYLPRLENGYQCQGCNVGCCIDEYNTLTMCTSPVTNGLFRDLHDCEGAHAVESAPPPQYRCYDCITPCTQNIVDAGHCPYMSTQDCLDQCEITDKWKCGYDKWGGVNCGFCRVFQLTDGTSCWDTEQECIDSKCAQPYIKEVKEISYPTKTQVQLVPPGYHYMPDGDLMLDLDMPSVDDSYAKLGGDSIFEKQLIDEDKAYPKSPAPPAAGLVPDTFCKTDVHWEPGCVDPLAWNYCSTCNADCNGSSAYRQTTQSGSILDSNYANGCCDYEKRGWRCHPSILTSTSQWYDPLATNGCSESCDSNMGGNGLIANYLTDCFETQSMCETETICAPGWECDESQVGCLQNCVAERWWHASQNHWDVSWVPQSSNNNTPCFKTQNECSSWPD